MRLRWFSRFGQGGPLACLGLRRLLELVGLAD
jgi:hypothetical protein